MALRTKKPAMHIALGDCGKEVEQAQKLLQKAGSTIKVTGEFNIGMVSAVKSFQRKRGLAVTGVIDLETWTKLNEKKPARKTGGAKK